MHRLVLGRNLLLKPIKYIFAPPAKFNDPFECQLSTNYNKQLKLSKTEELENLVKAYLTQEKKGEFDALFTYIRESNPDLIHDSNYIIYKAYEYILPRRSYSSSETLLKEVLFGDTGILCVTTEKDSILMWSHYANNHAGICFEFDAEKLSLMGDIYDVNYVPAYKEVDSIMDSILMKYNCWSYEKERRIVKHAWVSESTPTNPNEHCMPEKTITGLIFGCKTPYETVHEFTRIALARHPHIRIYMAERVEGNFKLEINEYDLSSYPSNSGED